MQLTIAPPKQNGQIANIMQIVIGNTGIRNRARSHSRLAKLQLKNVLDMAAITDVRHIMTSQIIVHMEQVDFQYTPAANI